VTPLAPGVHALGIRPFRNRIGVGAEEQSQGRFGRVDESQRFGQYRGGLLAFAVAGRAPEAASPGGVVFEKAALGPRAVALGDSWAGQDSSPAAELNS
jgi:hypothetical protein